MKKTIYLCILFSVLGLSSQGQGCLEFSAEIQALQSSQLLTNISNINNIGYQSKNTLYAPITFHFIKEPSGSANDPFNNVDLLDWICVTNEIFETSGIQFYLKDVTRRLVLPVPSTEIGSIPFLRDQMNGVRDSNSINVYVVNHIPTNFGLVDGYYNYTEDWVVMATVFQRVAKWYLAHELGHYFSLMHPYSRADFPILINTTLQNPIYTAGIPGYERLECQNGSNCTTTGDYICDTPPDYDILQTQFDSCQFLYQVYDPCGDLIAPMFNNLMTHNYLCEDEGYVLTPMQSDAIRAAYFSSRRSFLTSTQHPNFGVFQGESPSLTLPFNDATTAYFNRIRFEWEAIPGASHYFVEIDRFTNFNLIQNRRIVRDNFLEFNSALTPNSTYFWRVTATDGLNTCLGTSDVYKFKTGNQAGFAPAPGPIGHYFRVSPNPVQTNQDLIIQFDSEINDRSGVTKVYNSSGLLLLEEHTSIFKGENVWSVSIKNLPPNVYFLQLQTENTFQTQKFLVH